MASLFESIIQQNLSVLTRGHTLRPHVLLLGGPNTYIKGMQECWRHNICRMWKERGVRCPTRRATRRPDHRARQRAVLRGLGAVEFGKDRE
jgi:hypothetical protein